MIAAPRASLLAAAVLALTRWFVAHADTAPFDLAGPILEAKVTRGEQTLPISEVPNLITGDRVSIKADLPTSQSERYLMVVAFLRGSTNPPPSDWFFRCETWNRKCARDGITVTVPQEAQQVLVFLAPQTGGDFKTLVDAVRGQPGAFVRTSQDLNQATLDRSRLESYLEAIRSLNDAGPDRLKESAPLLARSLAIKVDQKCLDKIPELQAPCMMDGQDSLILNDGHSTSIVQALTSGAASDLAMEASYTPQLSYGYYSPYIASVLDIARIFDSFRTARYQYIPALAAQKDDRLALTLNTPPSFHDPKSVLVTALPAIESVQLPPLHAVNPKEIYCARNTSLILPVEGAPLVFSTGYAHDVSLRLKAADGNILELPAKADAQRGGFAVDTSALSTASFGNTIHGSLRGRWGFDSYDGPSFQLIDARTQSWKLAPDDSGKLVVGRENTIHLQAESVSCIDHIVVSDESGKEIKAEWKRSTANEVMLQLPLQEATPGTLKLSVTQYGLQQAQSIPLEAFSEAGHLDSFTIHAGDSQGILRGTRLDEVATLVVKGIAFVSAKLSSSQGRDELTMLTQDPQASVALKQGDVIKARVTLKDGRLLELKTSVDTPRPAATLIAKSVQASPSSADSNIQLTNPDELPQDATLTFSLRTISPAKFTHDESIQVATLDESFSTFLSLTNGAVTLENSAVVLARLDPAEAFGASAFGPLQFRVVVNGVQSDWQPLATLVRLPELTDLSCPASADLACKLSGSGLFLLDSVSDDPQFKDALQVPDGFPGYALPVPHPTNGRLYVKLRDDPSIVNAALLSARQMPSSHEETGRDVVGTAPPALDSPPAQVVSQTHPSTAPVPQAPPADQSVPPPVKPTGGDSVPTTPKDTPSTSAQPDVVRKPHSDPPNHGTEQSLPPSS